LKFVLLLLVAVCFSSLDAFSWNSNIFGKWNTAIVRPRNFFSSHYVLPHGRFNRNIMFNILSCAKAAIQPATINLQPFLSSSSEKDKVKVAQELWTALSTHGCFYVIGHGMDEASSLGAAKAIFSQPTGTKQQIEISPGPLARGYLPFGSESGRSDTFEPKEGFSCGYAWDNSKDGFPLNPMQGPNRLPPNLTKQAELGLHETLHGFTRVTDAIARAISLALTAGKDEAALSAMLKGGDTISILRLFRYFDPNGPHGLRPPESPPAADDVSGTAKADFTAPERAVGPGSRPAKRQLGSSEHTDWGFLTLILQDGAGGLEFALREGRGKPVWVPVTPVPGALVCNGGDFLSLLTRGRYSPAREVYFFNLCAFESRCILSKRSA